MLYLDNNATTALSENSKQAMQNLENVPYNASSTHSLGRKARKILEDSRKIIQKELNAKDYRVVFTGSGTEANNLAILGVREFFDYQYEILVSPIEHDSVLKAALSHPNHHMLKVNEEGEIDLEFLKFSLQKIKGNKIVSIMLANNETGVIQNITEITKICHEFGALLHCDCIQALGKIKIDLTKLNVDLATFSAHKAGGPVGAACLLVKEEIKINSIILGGGQEKGSRSGTENVHAIVGFAACVAECEERIEKMKKIEQLKKQMEEAIIHEANARIFSKNAPRLPNTSSISMPNAHSERQLIDFDLAQICVSAGSACSSGKIETSHVLKAMGASNEESSCAIRVSFGVENSEKEIKSFCQKWLEIYYKSNQKEDIKCQMK